MFKRIPRVIVLYLVSLGLMATVFIFKYNDLPLQVPLFYSLPESESQIVPMLYILLIPCIESIVLIGNMFIRTRWFQSSPVMTEILLWTDYAVCLFFTYIFIKIVTLVS